MAKYYALLTLDLNNVPPSKRKRYYAYLKSENWTKCANVTTTWRASFKEGVQRAVCQYITQRDLVRAAAYAGVADEVPYVLHLGTNRPVTGNAPSPRLVRALRRS